jgi:hypothetical protein
VHALQCNLMATVIALLRPLMELLTRTSAEVHKAMKATDEENWRRLAVVT